MTIVTVDNEFKTLIPPLSKDEYDGLEKSILSEGVRDALVVWNGILLDGHNRYEICQKHGIEYETVEKELADRDEAKLWIIENQLGRRNLPVIDRVTLEDKKREILAKQAKENLGGDHKSEEFRKSKDKNSCPLISRQEKRKNSTDYKIAKAAGTSEDTVRKVRKINELATPETKQLVREGKLSINQVYNAVAPKRPDPIKQAKKEHEEFAEKKKGSVVNWDDIQTDRLNQDIINTALFQDVLSLLNKIDAFGLKHKSSELKSLHDMIDPGERSIITERCEVCKGILTCIQENI